MMLTPLIEDHPSFPVDPIDEEFVEEQTVVGKLIHFLKAEELDQQYLILGVTRKFFGNGGVHRVIYTLPTVLFAAYELAYSYFLAQEDDAKWSKKVPEDFPVLPSDHFGAGQAGAI